MGAVSSDRRSSSTRRDVPIRGLTALLAMFVALAGTFVTSYGADAQAASGPIRCRVGAYLIDVYDFDYAANVFKADFWLWSVCPTADVKPLDTIEFINADVVTTRLQSFIPTGGVYWASRKVTGTFRQDWDLRAFPFDRHTLAIVLESGVDDASRLQFVGDTGESTYDRNMELPGWRISGFGLTNSIVDYQTTFGDPTLPAGQGSRYSRLNLTLDIGRTGLSAFFQLTAVVYAAFLLSLIVYFFHLEGTGALGIQMGLLAGALFATAINLASASAALGRQNGLTLIDQIHIAVLLYILVAAVIAVGSRYLLERGWTRAAIARLNRGAFVVAALSFLALTALLIFLAARAG